MSEPTEQEYLVSNLIESNEILQQERDAMKARILEIETTQRSAWLETCKRMPDIGPDPLKLNGDERLNRLSDEKVDAMLAQAAAIQQPHVPDQTALVWRVDINKLRERAILAEARLKHSRAAIAKKDAALRAALDWFQNDSPGAAYKIETTIEEALK